MMSNTEDLYHCCRWCKWYYEGECHNENFNNAVDFDAIWAVAEEGRLSGVIEETINSISTEKIERELEKTLQRFNLSGKRVDEALQVLRDMLPEWLDFECKPKLDEEISRLYQKAADESGGGGVDISDPESFYCKEFW